MSIQHQVTTQAIAQNSNPVNQPPAFVHDPIFWTILAIAVLIKIILDRPNSN